MLWTMNFWNRCVPAKNNYPVLSHRREICFEGVFFFFTTYVYLQFFQYFNTNWDMISIVKLHFGKIADIPELILNKIIFQLIETFTNETWRYATNSSAYHLKNIIKKIVEPIFGIEDLWVYNKLASLAIHIIYDILSSALLEAWNIWRVVHQLVFH